MSASTTVMNSSASTYNAPAFWERLWRMSGVGSLLLFVVALPGSHAIFLSHAKEVAALIEKAAKAAE